MKTIKACIFISLLLLCIAKPSFSQITGPDSDSSFKEFFQSSGDVIQIMLPLTALTSSIIKKDKEGTRQFAFAFVTNMAITHGLKNIIDKKRPGNSIARNAFPSGHTSAAFQAASFIQIRYGWRYGIPSYLLATYVGISRVEGIDTKHDYWDVLAGAGLGVLTSYIFTETLEKKSASLDVTFVNTYISLAYKQNF